MTITEIVGAGGTAGDFLVLLESSLVSRLFLREAAD
jgi:hypothetical protein